MGIQRKSMKVEAIKNQEKYIETFDIKISDTARFQAYERKMQNYILHIKEQRKIMTNI